jgi:hypothetical protein
MQIIRDEKRNWQKIGFLKISSISEMKLEVEALIIFANF